MLKTKKRNTMILCNIFAVAFFLIVSYFVLPSAGKQIGSVYLVCMEFVLLLLSIVVGNGVESFFCGIFENQILHKTETAYIQEFIDALRFCYSLDDFYEIIKNLLECKADCSVLYIDSEKNYVLYSSPDAITNDKKTVNVLNINFPASWEDGHNFFGKRLGIVSSYKKARGFFLCSNKHHFFVFCRYARLFDTGIYEVLYEEFVRFRKRAATIANLSEIASLSKDWEQLAETQRLFLPQTLPETNHLKMAAYYRPLVNVSGDYYTALPIDKHKTLLMLGDVSGKGLPAALIMGLIMNTVKIIEDKEDLSAIVRAVDKAIKSMKLQDKYTVLFISIVDTQKMTIRYVNASMSDPVILTRAPDGYTVKSLSSNCGVVGIIDLEDFHIDEQRLFRNDVIMFASDGVSEVMNEDGVELGDTDLYRQTITKSAAKTPQEYVDDVVRLIFDYKGENKLHDDITMLVTKVVS